MPGCRLRASVSIAALLLLPLTAAAQNADKPQEEAPKLDTSRGDAMIAEYFRRETQKLADACLADIQTADGWNVRKDEYRRQLREMLGLDPLPEKTDLKATVTGTLEHDEFTVEKLHFQSRPGLYVTGNLYIPKASAQKASGGPGTADASRGSPHGGAAANAAEKDRGADAPRSPVSDAPRSPAQEKYPAILYVCGHGNIKKDGISYGSKSHYQHHGAWFARNGYVCLVIDTLQLGEIEGIHHGTYRYGMWWWLNRGYTPAGVEAWNCVRALDYLQSRPEVDPEKLGVTGRSGGGAYSWWIAAIDERIKCAVPVAGITDLQNHVVDGCVEGHCDCMYMVNTYRWDYPQVAALVAPRPLLISNTDSDGIFPLDGVVRVFDKARRIYTLLGKRDQIGLNITSGGHKDTQELQVTALRWFNHHLKGYDGPVTNHAEKFFEPEQLKVFDKLPEDQINTKIHETFVAAAPPPKVPENKEEWEKMRKGWMKQLKEKCLRGWPRTELPARISKVIDAQRAGTHLQAFDIETQPGVMLRTFVLSHAGVEVSNDVTVAVLNDESWAYYLLTLQADYPTELESESYRAPKVGIIFPTDYFVGKDHAVRTIAILSPRGMGRHVWDQSEKKQVQHRRRFMLLGQTLEQMQAWDICQCVRALRTQPGMKNAKFRLSGSGADENGIKLLAALGSDDFAMLEIKELNRPTNPFPILLNSAKVTTLDELLAIVADRMPLAITSETPDEWSYLTQMRNRLQWTEGQLMIGLPPKPNDQ